MQTETPPRGHGDAVQLTERAARSLSRFVQRTYPPDRFRAQMDQILAALVVSEDFEGMGREQRRRLLDLIECVRELHAALHDLPIYTEKYLQPV